MKPLTHPHTGTDAEQELTRLCQQYPTDPEEILSQHLRQAAYGSAIAFPGAACGGYLAATHDEVPFLVGLGLAAIGGIKSIQYSKDIANNLKARWYLHHPEKWNEVIPQSNDTLFYLYRDRFTCTPTPVEALLGDRIYPVDDLQLPRYERETFLFLGTSKVREIITEKFTQREREMGAEHPGGYVTTTYEKHRMVLERKGQQRDIELPSPLSSLPEGSSASFVLKVARGNVIEIPQFYLNTEVSS